MTQTATSSLVHALGTPPLADYVDPASKAHFVVSTPKRNPLLWFRYLDGARRSYRRFGLEKVLEFDAVVDGRSTTLFFAALDGENRVVGGARVQGPYTSAWQTHALREWAGRPGTAELLDDIVDRLPDGAVEVKTVWHTHDAPHPDALAAALARTFVHALTLTGARWTLCTAARHAAPRWSTTGAVVNDQVTPVAYPDDRYQTVPMWWDRRNYANLADPAQLAPILDETARLHRADLSRPTGRAEDDSRVVSSIPAQVSPIPAQIAFPTKTLSIPSQAVLIPAQVRPIPAPGANVAEAANTAGSAR